MSILINSRFETKPMVSSALLYKNKSNSIAWDIWYERCNLVVRVNHPARHKCPGHLPSSKGHLSPPWPTKFWLNYCLLQTKYRKFGEDLGVSNFSWSLWWWTRWLGLETHLFDLSSRNGESAKNLRMTASCTITSRLSTHLFKYASQLSMHFLEKNLGFKIY